MSRPKPTLVIAIPAHNEQANIAALLRALLDQDRKNYRLAQILVVCDGCTDATAARASSVGSPLIKVLDDGTRMGKNARLNQIFATCPSDILVLCDADIVLAHGRVLSSLVRPFSLYPKLGLACGYHTPLPAHNLAQQVADFGFRVWDTARRLCYPHAGRYYCEGALRAFSHRFYRTFRYPATAIDEDSYSFYAAVTAGFAVLPVMSAEIHFKLPGTWADYVYQLKRYLSAPRLLSAHFSQSVLQQYELITPALKLRSWLWCSVRQPGLSLIYLPLQLIIKLSMLTYRPLVIWATSSSTKAVI